MKTKKKLQTKMIMVLYILIFLFGSFFSLYYGYCLGVNKKQYMELAKIEDLIRDLMKQKNQYIMSVKTITGHFPVKETFEFYSEAKDLYEVNTTIKYLEKLMQKLIVYAFIHITIGLIFLIQSKVQYNKLI